MVVTIRAKIKLNGQLVERLEWKRTDGRTDTTNLITSDIIIITSSSSYSFIQKLSNATHTTYKYKKRKEIEQG